MYVFNHVESTTTFCLIWAGGCPSHCLSGGSCGEDMATHYLSDWHRHAASDQAGSGREQGDTTAWHHTQVSYSSVCEYV